MERIPLDSIEMRIDSPVRFPRPIRRDGTKPTTADDAPDAPTYPSRQVCSVLSVHMV